MSLYGALDRRYCGRHIMTAAEGVADLANIDIGCEAEVIFIQVTRADGTVVNHDGHVPSSTYGIHAVAGSADDFTDAGGDIINWLVKPKLSETT